MSWLEIHQSLRDHRKVLMIADELSMAEPHVAGHLVFLWLWSLDNAPDGSLPDSARLIERASGWAGEPGAFVAALVRAGLLERDGERLRIHDWDDYAGKLIDQRHANADRQRRHRERVKAVMGDAPTAPITGTSPLRKGATEQNLTEQNLTEPDHGGRPAPKPETVSHAGTRDAAAAAAPPETPPPSRQASPPKRAAAEQPTPEGFALLGDICEVTNAAPRGEQRRRDALQADVLLRRCGGDAKEALDYVQYRLNRGDSPQLQFAAKDYAPGWRKKAELARAGTNGRPAVSTANDFAAYALRLEAEGK